MQAILITDPRTNFQYNLDRPKVAFTEQAETLSGSAIGQSNIFKNFNRFEGDVELAGTVKSEVKIKAPTIDVNKILLSGLTGAAGNVLISGGNENCSWESVGLALSNVTGNKLKVEVLGKSDEIKVDYAENSNYTSNSTNVSLVTESSTGAATRYITFADENPSTAKYKPLKTNTSLQFDLSSGNVSATSFTATSSRTKKHEIKPITFKSTELINEIKVVSFKYKPEVDASQYQRYGFIAEDAPSEFTADGLHMDYSNCIGLLLKAVQELDERLSKLENK